MTENGGDEVRALGKVAVHGTETTPALAAICRTGASTPDVANTAIAASSRASVFR